MRGQVECTQLLLDNGQDPNLLTKYGKNAADLARTYGHESVLYLMMGEKMWTEVSSSDDEDSEEDETKKTESEEVDTLLEGGEKPWVEGPRSQAKEGAKDRLGGIYERGPRSGWYGSTETRRLGFHP